MAEVEKKSAFNFAAVKRSRSKDKQEAAKEVLPTTHHTGAHKQLAFAVDRDKDMSGRTLLSRWWKRLTDASTGSPSDGLAGGTSEGSASVAAFLQTLPSNLNGDDEDEDWSVDEIIVEREDRDEGELDSSGRPRQTTTGGSRTVPSNTDGQPREQEFMQDVYHKQGLMWRVWRAMSDFFDPKFDDPHAEIDFRKTRYYSQKKLLFFSTIYLIVNWILYLILNRSSTLYEQIVYYGGLTLVTLPLPVLIFFDFPQKHRTTFQIILCIATWYCAFSEVIQIKQCHFYSPEKQCNGKDFLALLYYATGFPMLVMFSHGSRLPHAIAQVIFLGLLLGLVIPDQDIFARNVINFVLFSIFIQAFHWSREKAERRMFRLNTQLKVAYKAQQKAQISESSANQAKRRFASYIFHEVRVPLNTAMLAFQNLQTTGVFQDAGENRQALEIYALDSSLSMMQQVLNDVLDLNRMDAGRFESTLAPFCLHKTLRSMMGAARVATDAKGLRLNVELDPLIDQLSHDPTGDGLFVVGDVVRLQQVVHNLTSNATKFSKAGEIKVTTKLLHTVVPPTATPMSPVLYPRGETWEEKSGWSDTVVEHAGKEERGEGMGPTHRPNQFMTFRLEVKDTGPGLKPADLAGSRLFKPFSQTRVGRASGEGSGLGLAIVRQILTLQNGRLGIISKKDEGATFWFELTYRIATVDEILKVQAEASPTPPSPPPLKAIPISVHSPSLASSQAGYIPIPSPLSMISPSSVLAATPSTSYSSQPSWPSSALTQVAVEDEVAEEPLMCLVVDDDALTRALFTRMLERLGVIVATAQDGQEFLDLVMGTGTNQPTYPKPDLVCLDNQMPNLTGEQAVRKLREAGRTDLYVVGCTGNALREDQASYLQAGADRIIPKPLLLRDVKDIVDTAKQRRTDARRASTATQVTGGSNRESSSASGKSKEV